MTKESEIWRCPVHGLLEPSEVKLGLCLKPVYLAEFEYPCERICELVVAMTDPDLPAPRPHPTDQARIYECDVHGLLSEDRVEEDLCMCVDEDGCCGRLVHVVIRA